MALCPGVDSGIMDGAMAKGEVAMVISGPWLGRITRRRGSRLPWRLCRKTNGKVTPPFLGVYRAALNAALP